IKDLRTVDYKISLTTTIVNEIHVSWSKSLEAIVLRNSRSWLEQLREGLEKVVDKIVPDNFQLDEKVIKAFKDLDDIVEPKLKDATVHPELEWDAVVRKSNDLCEEEVKFVRERKVFIREAFAKYVGVDVSEIHVDDIPEITFMGSGGGFRAMIAVTAYFSCLKEAGLYDCGVYISGLSGSCWNLAQLYSSVAQLHENPLQALIEFYQTKLGHGLASGHGVLMNLAQNASPESAVELTFGGLLQKKNTGMKLTIMDLYGALLAVKLMLGSDPSKQHSDFKLSHQRKYLEGGKNMMPLYVAVEQIRPWKDSLEPEDAALIPNYEQVLEEHKKKPDHYRWYEFNPYEVGSDEATAWIPAWAFGRKFESGKSLERHPEQNLGLLIGLIGAAPSGPLISDITQFLLLLPEGKFKTEFKKTYDEAMEKIGPYKKQEFEGMHPVSQPQNYSFIYRLNPPPYELGPTNNKKFGLIDSGVSNDFPMYPITHPNRKIDVVIGFDCSS
ncbi:13608_t:CDS:2, partial [Acaulospora morrowiae]